MEVAEIFQPHHRAMEAARARADQQPLASFDVANRDLFVTDTVLPYFERLRRESPIHYCPDSEFGPYWSITRFEDIKAIELDWEHFSSEPSIVLFDAMQGRDHDAMVELDSFITMDPPRHTVQRRAVRPSVSPNQVRQMEDLIRQRAGKVLDSLPIGEELDWVDNVSIELTTQMLATLFRFPFEDRRKLTRWSDVTTAVPGDGIIDSWAQREAELGDCLETFLKLWDERAAAEPDFDLLSMLAHAPETADMNKRPFELLGNMLLLIVGGNDTTRNSMTGGVLALNEYPDEYEKLRANLDLIPNMVDEIIRWQTPLAYMRRTVTRDVSYGGVQFQRGDKVVLWYLSANRDEDVFPDGDRLRIDRENAREQLSFGTGIHFCLGAHLGRLQLRVLWEEAMKRFSRIEVTGEPTRVRSNFVRGYSRLPVRLHAA
ncbi:MAG TPA: cytochrome P450 [Candidatus Binatia bacterium]|nr:cytochrome P450 [Candidatus Binatia bacterium]